jgi:uncharacterized membrane protein
MTLSITTFSIFIIAAQRKTTLFITIRIAALCITLCSIAFMLSVAIKRAKLSVFRVSVIMLSVVATLTGLTEVLIVFVDFNFHLQT